MKRRWIPLLASCLWLASCGSEVTELVLVVGSDMAVPSPLRQIDLRVIGPDGSTAVDTTVAFDLPGAPFMPLSLSLVLEGPEPAPVRVTVVGTTADGSTVERTVVTGFVEGESRALPIRLYERCLDVVCGEGQSCGDSGTCEDERVNGAFLPQWTGEPADFAP